MLDEPSLGLSPLISATRCSRRSAGSIENGLTILLVEQNTQLALELADRAYVLRTRPRGRWQGAPESILADTCAAGAYLGRGSAKAQRGEPAAISASDARMNVEQRRGSMRRD